MNSVLRRVRSLEDQDPIEAYPATGARGGGALERDWLNEVDWPEFFNRPPRPVGVALPGVSPAVPVGIPTPPSGTVPVLGVPTLPAATGRRLALTIGINAYPTAPLHGCVADADLWDKTLRGLGFEMQPPLRDGDATRERIMAEMNALIGGARAGDTLVIQYAGHGTQVEDLDGDEADGDTPGEDEAICPVDFANGRFLIDDDVAEIVARLPAGAQLTFLLDCCHSGTGSRFAAVGDAAEPMDPTAKPRFVRFTDELRQAHREFRASAGRAAASRGFGSKPAQGSMREVTFGACQSHEVAWEVQGQGEFTRRAHDVLAANVANGLSNVGFYESVVRAFGSKARQTPHLDCDVSMRDAPWLGVRRDVAIGADR